MRITDSDHWINSGVGDKSNGDEVANNDANLDDYYTIIKR